MNEPLIIFTEQVGSPSGWGRYSADLLAQLRTDGREVIVFCYQKSATELPGVEQHVMLPNPLRFGLNYLFAWRYAWQAYRILKRDRRSFTVAHAFVESYAPAICVLSWLLDVPYVLTVHGDFGIKPSGNAVYKLLQQVAYRHAALVICVSSYTLRRLKAEYAVPRSEVIPNGVNDFVTPTTVRQPIPILLSVGEVKPRKGAHLVIEALPEIARTFPDVRYHIVGGLGDKTYVSRLCAQASALGVADKVVFEGLVSEERLWELYAQAGLFVLTPVSSRWSFEGFGLVYLEANTRGLPVIGTTESGAEEAINPGHSGLLAQQADSADIARTVLEILSNTDRYTTMSSEAPGWAAQHRWALIAPRYAGAYTAVVKKDAPGYTG